MSKPSLAQFLPISFVEEVIRHRDSRPKKPDGSTDYSAPDPEGFMETYSEQCDQFRGYLKQFLLAVRATRSLPQVPHAERRESRFADAWNAFVTGSDDEYRLQAIAEKLSGGLFVHISYDLAKLPETYKDIVAKADGGTFEWFQFGSDSQDCMVTGKRLHVEMTDWAPVLGVLEGPTRETRFVSVGPLPAPKVEHLVIQVPSGELLVSDWFRHPAFTDSVEDPDGKAYKYSLNNDAGKARKTAWHANENGFMSVFVGNTMPAIVQRGDHVLFARVDEDDVDGDANTPSPLEGDVLGHVCTDLWAATAIDREVLTGVFERTMSRAEAEAAVVELLEETDHVTVKVKPGVMHLYHTANPAGILKFRADGVSDKAVEEMYCVLSERELDWVPKSAPAPVATATPARRRPRP